MANEIIAWRYTSDNGNYYVTGVDRELTTQTDGAGASKFGGQAVAASAAMDPLPRNLKPRRAVMGANGKRSRYVPIFDTTCALAVATTTAVTLDIEDSDGASTTYTRQKKLGEAYRRRIKQ